MSDDKRLALLALLEAIQWSGQGRRYDDGSHAQVCPVCREVRSYEGVGGYRYPGHVKGCALHEAILALEKPD